MCISPFMHIGWRKMYSCTIEQFYWIKKPKELLIPVLDNIVLEINVPEKKVIIKPVGEWLDED